MGGVLIGETDNDTTFTDTAPGGTPVSEKSWATLVPPKPVLTMYSVVVELRDWTGWTEARLLLGPNEARSMLDAPASISLLLRTQYCAPTKTWPP